jgi:hypothetical protein
VLAAGAAASLPIVVETVHAITAGWAPIGDDGMVAIRSYDVLSGQSPLLGMPSSGPSGVLDQQAYHPGPLLFWLLALPAHFIGATSLPVTVGIVNVACVMGVVALAHRRGGWPLAAVVAVAIPIMLASLPTDALADVWNPSAPLLPFTLLIFVAWSLACGEYRLLPLAVLLASFAPQSHLIYSLPALGALVVGVVGMILTLRSRPAEPTGRSSLVRWVVAALLVGLVCWSAPLIDQAVNRPGNLVLLGRAATANEPTLGTATGRRALVRAVGVPPWWLRAPRGPLERVADLNASPGTVANLTALLVLAGLVAVSLLGWRRRHSDVLAVGALGLVLCAALVLTTASIPKESFASVGYSLWWASPTGMFVWVTLGWSLLVLFVRLPRLAAGQLRTPFAAAGVAAALAAGLIVSVSADQHEEPFDQLRVITDSLTEELANTSSVRVDATFGEGGFFVGRGFQFGAVYALRRQGHTVRAPAVAALIGDDYKRPGGDRVATIDATAGKPTVEGRKVAAVLVPPDRTDNPFSKAPPVTVTASIR